MLDDAGREISVTRTAGGKSLTTAFTYDALGRKLTETTPEGIVTNWSYTSRGEVETVSGGVYTQHYTYDSQGRILTLTTYQNEDTPEITTYAYDSRGRMTRRTYPDNRSEQYTYRGDGKLSTYTNVRGIEQRYSYNQAGEQTGFSSGNDISRSFSHDQSGNILSVTDANGSYTFTRDEFGNVLTETAGSHTLTRSYDEYRRLIGLTLDGVALYTLSYGTDGRIEKVICGGAAVVYSYRSGTGQIASRNWQIGEDAPFLTFNDNYDALDRLSGVSVDDVPEISYTLDDDSRRITAELVDDSIWTYGYDDKSQLLTATRKSGETGLNAMTYAYDGIGNRTTASEDSAVVNYTANLLNQYTAVNEDTPAYDADGNMLTNAGWTYTWNSENRLVKAEKGTAKLEFAYDYQGRRMFKKVYDGDTLVKHEKYLYNGYKLIAVYDGMNSDALLKTFVWQPVGLDVPLCMTAGSAVYYYLTDGNKNVTGLFDGTGTRAATYMYDPFGQTLSANGTAAESNPFRFSSEFFDTETGLVYYNYRYYDPKLGRWTKRDSFRDNGNTYGMAHNNCINQIDIWGNVSLGYMFLSIYFTRLFRAIALIFSGTVINYFFIKPVRFDDENHEVFDAVPGISLEIRESARSKQLTNQWQKYELEKVNIAAKYGVNGLAQLLGDFPSAGWFLNTSSNVYIYGDYFARCNGDQIEVKDIEITYEWHDNIDANSLWEAAQKGQFSDITNIETILAAWIGLIEGTVDLTEKVFAQDFPVIIYGKKKVSNHSFPAKVENN